MSNTLFCCLNIKNKELDYNILEGEGSLEIMSEALPYRFNSNDRVIDLLRKDETLKKMNHVGSYLRTKNYKEDVFANPGKYIHDFQTIDFSIFDNVYFYITTQNRWYFLHDGMPISIERVVTDWRKFSRIFDHKINLLTKEKM